MSHPSSSPTPAFRFSSLFLFNLPEIMPRHTLSSFNFSLLISYCALFHPLSSTFSHPRTHFVFFHFHVMLFCFFGRFVMANTVTPKSWENFVEQHFHQLFTPATGISGCALYLMKISNTMVFKRYLILCCNQPQVCMRHACDMTLLSTKNTYS